jgi:hypothetical protein
MFSFLWTGKKDKEGMHLISWKRISKPKKIGGWGIKNIFTFGKALAAKVFGDVLCCLVFGMRLLLKNTYKRNLWKHGLGKKRNLGLDPQISGEL